MSRQSERFKKEPSNPEIRAQSIIRAVVTRPDVTQDDLNELIGLIWERLSDEQVESQQENPPIAGAPNDDEPKSAPICSTEKTETKVEIFFWLMFWMGVFLLIRFNSARPFIEVEREQSPNFIGGSNSGGGDIRWIAPARDIDPSCGKTVATEKAKSSVYAGDVYYFCSRECREVFEAAPDLYVGARRRDLPALEHSHG